MRTSNVRGIILSGILVFATIAIIVIAGLTSWFGVTLRTTRTLAQKEQVFQIAEAGIDYYRWYLAHYPDDFQDGTGQPGPYIHNFFNTQGVKVGEFSLDITPPPLGTSMVTLRSTGTVASTTISRTIEVELDKASLTRYTFISNHPLHIRSGSEVFGAIHSNNGIRMDGIAHNLVTSSVSTYDDQDHSGANEHAIHTHVSPVDPLPNAPLPTRTDIFQAGRVFPVPPIDFDSLTITIAEMKTIAQSGGLYFAGTDKEGYHAILKTNDTFDLYKVDTVLPDSPSDRCKKPDATPAWAWSTNTINTESFLGNYAFPANGVIYFEDNIWVEGQLDSARITIVAGRFPNSPQQQKNIIINKDITYTSYTGDTTLGLIAQNDITVGMHSDNDLRIDAAMIAKSGRIGREYYPGPEGPKPGCSPYHIRNSLIVYGMIASYESYGFKYTDNTGYQTRTISYDANLVTQPPPFFPSTGDAYKIISWKEIR